MRTRKNWIIIAVVLIIFGAFLAGTSLVIMRFDLSKLNTGHYETNSYEVKDDFDNISVYGDTEKIVFELSKDGKCTVICREDKKASHEVRAEGETLSVRLSDAKFSSMMFGFRSEEPTITISLPKDKYTSLSVDSHTGDIEIPKEFTFDDIRIQMSTGDIACSAEAGKSMEFKTETGDVDIRNCTAGTVSVITNTGEISLKDAVCKGSIEIITDTGKTQIDNVTCGSMNSAGTTGDILLKDVIASGEFHIERDTGDVTFKDSDAEEIFVITSTGEVSGSLLSEKQFITKTDTGEVKVPETTTGGRCEITTDTGDITIYV